MSGLGIIVTGYALGSGLWMLAICRAILLDMSPAGVRQRLKRGDFSGNSFGNKVVRDLAQTAIGEK